MPAYLEKRDLPAFWKAMTEDYKGNAVDAFLQYLKQNDQAFHKDGETYYAKFCSIIQSSGTGKTRLLLELAKRDICVLYMNIRDDLQGYPPRDDIPAGILLYNRSGTVWGDRIHCQAFFATVFKLLAIFLRENPDFCKEFCKMDGTVRTIFFKRLQEELVNVESEIRSSLGIDVMNRYYREMVSSERFRRTKKNEPKVVIALDEAHVLHETDHCRTTALLKAIKEYSSCNEDAVWVVFASTAPEVAHLPSPRALFPPPRDPLDGELLFPPFTQLGWDQHAPVLEEVDLDKVAWGSHILRYGRPLWRSLKGRYTVSQILHLATQKLYGGATFHQSHYSALAVLGQRFALDINFGHPDAVHDINTLLARHLRICIKTTEDLTWSYTTYPSEPVLSAMAARVLVHEYLYTLSSLTSMVREGQVNIGDTGELASRFLWLLAKDFFVSKHGGLSSGPRASDEQDDLELEDCQPVSVVYFLEFVFGPQIWETAPEARKVYQDAYINFSHWVRMGVNITQEKKSMHNIPFDKWTTSLWVRTSAVQCCTNLLVIPMYFKLHHPGSGSRMSHILISNRAHNNPLDKIRRDDEDIAPNYHGLPYIVISVDLGGGESSFGVKLDTETDEDTCLRIYASGLNETTYPFLKESEWAVRYCLTDLYKESVHRPELLDDFGG